MANFGEACWWRCLADSMFEDGWKGLKDERVKKTLSPHRLNDDMNDAYVDEDKKWMTYRTIIKFHIWSKEELVAFEKVLGELNSHICGWFWSIVVERAMRIKEVWIQVGDGNFACLIANVVELLVQLWKGEWLGQSKETKRMLNQLDGSRGRSQKQGLLKTQDLVVNNLSYFQ